jgi:hypothetical protein
MSSSLQDRERAFEEKFHHDKEFEFKVKARRNRILGLWVGQQLQLTQEDSESYGQALVALIFDNPKDEALLEKVSKDLAAKEKLFTAIQLQKQLQYCYEDARNQLLDVKDDGTKKR